MRIRTHDIRLTHMRNYSRRAAARPVLYFQGSGGNLARQRPDRGGSAGHANRPEVRPGVAAWCATGGGCAQLARHVHDRRRRCRGHPLRLDETRAQPGEGERGRKSLLLPQRTSSQAGAGSKKESQQWPRILREPADRLALVPALVPPELAGDFAAFNLWRLEMSRDVFDHDPAMETVRTVWNRTEGQAEFTAIAAIPEPVDPYATADWNPSQAWSSKHARPPPHRPDPQSPFRQRRPPGA